jgi:predicted RecB family endonuclease
MAFPSATAGRLKAEGVMPGVADIVIVWQGRAIAIELKAKRGSQSPAQKAWADATHHRRRRICRLPLPRRRGALP